MRIGESDSPAWVISKKGIYTSRETLEEIRTKKLKVDWWKLIWFSCAIPQYAFVMWLTMKNCLSTGDRLMQWGYNGEVKCLFCKNVVECRDHLLFESCFSRRIWREEMKRCLLLDAPIIWGGRGLEAVISKLSWGGAVYHIWRQRNDLKPRSEERLQQDIAWAVRNRILGKEKFKRGEKNVVICNNWGIH